MAIGTNICRGLHKPTTYGDNITLQVMSNLLRVQFLVATKSSNTVVFHIISLSRECGDESGLPLLLLGHYDENQSTHYVSLSVNNDQKFASVINPSVVDPSIRNVIVHCLGLRQELAATNSKTCEQLLGQVDQGNEDRPVRCSEEICGAVQC